MRKKMKISDLKVNSFVTNLQEEISQTVKGGITGKNGWCRTGWAVCASVVFHHCEHPSDYTEK
ncbi:MAG: pinensin family lanthipeptide [Bacteroidota bacterium]